MYTLPRVHTCIKMCLCANDSTSDSVLDGTVVSYRIKGINNQSFDNKTEYGIMYKLDPLCDSESGGYDNTLASAWNKSTIVQKLQDLELYDFVKMAMLHNY